MAAVTKGENKRPVALRIAPATLRMVDDLMEWVGAPSKAWVWESAVIRWHAQEQTRRAEQEKRAQ